MAFKPRALSSASIAQSFPHMAAAARQPQGRKRGAASVGRRQVATHG